MKSPRIRKNIVVGLAAVLFFLTANAARAGLGISPAEMITPNLSKGSTVERTFVLSRSDPKEDLFFTVTTEGATKDWTTLDKGTTFTMPAGEQRFPIVVTAKIPLDAANGEYKGGIRMTSSTDLGKATSGNGAAIMLAALIQTDFTVTGEQILEYEVSDLGIRNIEEGSPVEVSVTVTNTGNVTARPTKVHVEIFDKLNKTKLESTDVTEMGSVEPFTTGSIAIAVPTKLTIDQYWARVTAYKDETVLKEENMVFEIVAVGSLQKSGNLKEIQLNKKSAVGEVVKIIGVFENTGKANYSAKLVSEIYKGKKLIKVAEGDLTTVNTGKTENLSVYFTPEASGNFTIKSRVDYSGGKSNERESGIAVGNVGWFGLAWFQIIALLGLIIAIIYVIYSKKKKNKRDIYNKIA